MRVCQSIGRPLARGGENHAIFASRSPTATRWIRPFLLRCEQMPETSSSGTWTTRHTRSRFFLNLPFAAMDRSLWTSKKTYNHCQMISLQFLLSGTRQGEALAAAGPSKRTRCGTMRRRARCLGAGAVDLPFDHRRARRTIMGERQFAPWCGLSIHSARPSSVSVAGRWSMKLGAVVWQAVGPIAPLTPLARRLWLIQRSAILQPQRPPS